MIIVHVTVTNNSMHNNIFRQVVRHTGIQVDRYTRTHTHTHTLIPPVGRSNLHIPSLDV